MPYTVRKVGRKFKACKKGTSKCFSKRGLSKKRAIAQMVAIKINEGKDS